MCAVEAHYMSAEFVAVVDIVFYMVAVVEQW